MFLPNANLYDFNGYTLVLQPQKADARSFLRAYRQTMERIYAPSRRLSKLADDVPRLLRKGSWTAAGLDLADMWDSKFDPVPGRNFMAGHEVLPPETVPFATAISTPKLQRLDICSPTLVTDEEGRLLPGWRQAQKVSCSG